MASPQLENGHLRIANEVWEHLMAAGLNGTQMSIVMAAIRKTWGFHKKAAPISLQQFETATGRGHRSIRRQLGSLIKANILIQASPPSSTTPATWVVNKDWESWEGVKVTTGSKRPRGQTDHGGGGQSGQKEGVKPTTIKRQYKDKVKDNSENLTSSPNGLLLKGGETHYVTLVEIKELKRAYNTLNIETELVMMSQWCKANPGKRKTKKGIDAFIVNWLNRALKDQQANNKRMSRTEKNRQAVQEFVGGVH